MKYLPLSIRFTIEPETHYSAIQALQIIGQKNPQKVKFRKLKNGTKLSSKDFYRLGILNVRKCLNGNLGSFKKYSNRMIDRSAKILNKDKSQNNRFYIKIPHNDFLNIINTIYKLLKKCDKASCTCLLNKELSSTYQPKINFDETSLKTISPVQTHIILLSEAKGHEKELLNKLKKKIGG